MCANEILSKEYIAKIKPEQLEALVKNGTFTKNADGTYTSNVPINNPDAVKADNEVKGLAVESQAAKDAAPEQPQKIALADNNALQKQKYEQYKKEYTELYKKDPSILKTDIADVVYAKEKEQLATSLENGAKTVDGRILLKDRYMREFASDEETEKFKETLNKKLAFYSDPKNAELARNKYNEAFHEAHKENYIRAREEMTAAEIKLIAHREALDESVKLEDSTYGKMANSLIQNRHLNKAINTTNKYEEKIQEAIKKGDTEKAEKLKQEGAKALVKAKASETKEVEDNKEELIEYMAEAKLNREIAEERVKNRVIHWDKDGTWKEDDNNKALDKSLRNHVMENPNLFCDEVKEGEKGDFTANGKSYKFNSEKFKDYYVALSNENEIDTTEEKDAYNDADYMTSIKNRKRGMDHAKLNEFENELIKTYPEYADPAKRAEFLRKHPEIEAKLGHLTAPDKQKDRSFQKKCAKLAGLDYEKDKTNMMRAGHVFKKAFAGALGGFAGGCLMEGFACTKVVNGKYSDIIKYSQDVAYQYKQAYSQDVKYKHSQEVTVTGSVGYEQPVTVEGYAKYNDVVVVEGDEAFHTKVTVDGYTPYEGDVNWKANGTVQSTDKYVSEYWDGDFKMGEQTTNVVKDIPWDASGTEHYSGEAYFSKTVDVDGTVHFKREVPVEGEVYYKQTVNAKGEVQFEKTVVVEGEGTVRAEGVVEGEGTVTAEGEVEAKGQTKARHKFDMSVPIGMAISGGISGAIAGLFTMKNVKYHGGTPEVAARQKIIERQEKPPVPTPVQPVEIKPEDDVVPTPVETPEDIRPKYKGTTQHKVDMWDLNRNGEYWSQMAALYENSDGKPLTFKQAMEIVHFYNDAYDKAHTLNGLPNGGKIDLGLFDMDAEMSAKYKRKNKVGSFEKIATRVKTFVQTKFNPLTGKWEAVVRGTDGKEMGRSENVDKAQAQNAAIANANVEARDVIWEDKK